MACNAHTPCGPLHYHVRFMVVKEPIVPSQLLVDLVKSM